MTPIAKAMKGDFAGAAIGASGFPIVQGAGEMVIDTLGGATRSVTELPDNLVTLATGTEQEARTAVAAQTGDGLALLDYIATTATMGGVAASKKAAGEVAGEVAQAVVRPKLVHLTTPEAAASIRAEGVLRGVYAGPASNASASGWGITVRTGLTPSQAGAVIEIPEAALYSFSKPISIGPITAWQRATGHQFTPTGQVDLSTGAFTATGANWNQRGIYGAGLVVDALIVGAGSLIYADYQ